MKPEKRHRFDKLVRSGYRRLGVSDKYQTPQRGVFRVLFALRALDRNLLPADFEFGTPDTSELAWPDIAERPTANVDPVGAAIDFLYDDDGRRLNDFPVDPAAQKSLAESPNLLRQKSLPLIKAVLQQTCQLALALGYDGRRKIRPSAEARRFRMYRTCLTAESCTDSTDKRKLLESARKSVQNRKNGPKRKYPQFSANWLQLHVRRKGQWTYAGWLKNLGNLSRWKIRAYRARAAREDSVDDPEDDPDDPKEQKVHRELSEKDISELAGQYGRDGYLAKLKIASAMFPGNCPAARGLSEATVVQIIELSKTDSAPGPTLVAFMCIALAGVDALWSVRFHRPIGSGLISTIVHLPQKRAFRSPLLLKPSGKRFFRYVPSNLAARFKRYKRRFGLKRMG